MPALINIEIYESLNKIMIDGVDIKLNNFLNHSEVKSIETNSEFPNYRFKQLAGLTFSYYKRNLQLEEKWHAIEFCTSYGNVFQQKNKLIQFNEGVKDGFIKILKEMNEHFSSPMILVTNEICNGFFFEYNFGNGSKDFAEFELGLIGKNKISLIDTSKYTILEEKDEFNIYIQENEYVTWK